MNPESLFLLCPHCETDNPAFGAQRCVQCRLNMRSDAEQAVLQEGIRPVVEGIEELLEKWAVDTTQEPDEAHLMPWMDQAHTYAQQYPFLKPWLASVKARLSPWYTRNRRRQLLRLNVLILFALAIAPVLAWVWAGSGQLILLLSLPVVGWGYLGVFRFLRVMSVLLLLLSAGLHAQSHNGEIFRQLMEQHFQENSQTFGEIQGEYPARYFPAVAVDTASEAVLIIAPLDIEYELLPGQLFVRSLSLNLRHKSAVTQSFSYSYVDTLSSVNLRQVIKKSPGSLRGDNPRIGARWVRPIALISLSVVGLVMLFFIRSG